jgi:hypothetical protein
MANHLISGFNAGSAEDLGRGRPATLQAGGNTPPKETQPASNWSVRTRHLPRNPGTTAAGGRARAASRCTGCAAL